MLSWADAQRDVWGQVPHSTRAPENPAGQSLPSLEKSSSLGPCGQSLSQGFQPLDSITDPGRCLARPTPCPGTLSQHTLLHSQPGESRWRQGQDTRVGVWANMAVGMSSCKTRAHGREIYTLNIHIISSLYAGNSSLKIKHTDTDLGEFSLIKISHLSPHIQNLRV